MNTESAVGTERKGYCSVCGVKDNYNVCVRCDATKTARQVMYYVFLRGTKDQDESSKKISMSSALIFNEKIFKNLDGLDENERKQFDTRYELEINQLKHNFNYAKKIYKFDDKTGKSEQNISYIFDAMRWENIQKNCSGCRQYLCNLAKELMTNIIDIINCGRGD